MPSRRWSGRSTRFPKRRGARSISAPARGWRHLRSRVAFLRPRSSASTSPRAWSRRRDAERLPFGDGSFELVTLANMIPFFDELARLVAPGGHVVFSFSSGPQTPIWVPPDRLRRELERRGFAEFADFESGAGIALLARKGDPL
jgi:SAM-dependent methyltransferase